MIQTHQHTRARPLHDRATTVSAADSTAAAPEPNSLPSQKRPPPANAPDPAATLPNCASRSQSGPPRRACPRACSLALLLKAVGEMKADGM